MIRWQSLSASYGVQESFRDFVERWLLGLLAGGNTHVDWWRFNRLAGRYEAPFLCAFVYTLHSHHCRMFRILTQTTSLDSTLDLVHNGRTVLDSD